MDTTSLEFIDLTDDGNVMTCKMPPDEMIVAVRLADGTVHNAFYACNIMDAGDWDFAPVDDNGDITDDAFSSDVVAWATIP